MAGRPRLHPTSFDVERRARGVAGRGRQRGMADILIVYNVLQWPPVVTVQDSLYAFDRHSTARCWYLNLGVRSVPRWLARVPFDAVVFHTTLLWDRVNPARIRATPARSLRRLQGVGRHRVALPQDEYLHSRALVRPRSKRSTSTTCSRSRPRSEWDKLYDGVDRDRVGISRVLTGYLAPDTLARIDAIVRGQGERPDRYRLSRGGRPWAVAWAPRPAQDRDRRQGQVGHGVTRPRRRRRYRRRQYDPR